MKPSNRCVKIAALVLIAVFAPLVAGAAECIRCKDEISEDEKARGFCSNCGFLVPKPGEPPTPNGVAVFNFGKDILGFDVAPIFVKAIAETDKYEPEGIKKTVSTEYMDYDNLTDAFRNARTEQQELVLVGTVNKADEMLCVTAEVYDIETGHRVAFGSADVTGDSDGYTTKEELGAFAASLVNKLPYRGRYLRQVGEKPAFEFARGISPKSGGHVEIFRSYDYACRKYVDEEGQEGIPAFWYDLSNVNPKYVVDDPGKFKITPGGASEPGRITIKGVQFEDDDICYYYYPPEIPAVKEKWFVSIGLSYGWHDYSYVGDIDSVERAGGAGLSFGRRLPFLIGRPTKLTFGGAVDVPANYRYAYGGVYEGRGRIMGAYIVSANAAFDVHPRKEWGFLPWFGAGVVYFSPLGHGVYEQEGGGLERYDNDLWTGLLLGPRCDWEIPFYLGRRKQTRVFLGGACYWPVAGEHKKHFGPLVRIPFGFRYYF